MSSEDIVKYLNSLHSKIVRSSFAKNVTENEITALIECKGIMKAKKPIMKPYFNDMKEEYLCCPTCGEILTDRFPDDNKNFYFHCLNCGQKFSWESDIE